MNSNEEVRVLLESRRWFADDPAIAEVVAEKAIGNGDLTQLLVQANDRTYQVIVDADGKELEDQPNGAWLLLQQIVPDEQASSVRLLSAETSNTGFVFDERILLKLFRKLATGPNPEIDVPQALRSVGFACVPDVLGRWRDGDTDLACVQPFLSGANDGWSLALTSLRQLFAEAGVPGEAGGDFGPEAARLGAVTAEMHRAMPVALGTQPADVEVLATQVAGGEMASRLRGLDDVGALIRVHGDYHLGQVLRTDESWFVVDFEGEPTRTRAERLAFHSPLKDVAGMVRSFDYAAAIALREQDEDFTNLARAWEQHNRSVFLESYWDGMVGSGLLPSSQSDTLTLLDAFELDKALYEVAYERAHRPAWAEIPEAAVARLRAA